MFLSYIPPILRINETEVLYTYFHFEGSMLKVDQIKTFTDHKSYMDYDSLYLAIANTLRMTSQENQVKTKEALFKGLNRFLLFTYVASDEDQGKYSVRFMDVKNP